MPPKPTLHSHTHCQVAQANAQTKTWHQRVSVPLHNRQTINTKDRRAAANSSLA
uniref:hypothetical protein n=1 Tax=Roseivirga sp. TaxID=1964215 RepID=UPI0040486899